MPFLCDVNVAVAGAAEGHSLHDSAAKWLQNLGKGEAVIVRNVQLAFLRLLTNTAAMKEDVLRSKDAWRAWTRLHSDERFRFVAEEPTGLEAILEEYAEMLELKPANWSDAYLAAFSRASKIPIVTFDRGFSQYRELEFVLLKPS